MAHSRSVTALAWTGQNVAPFRAAQQAPSPTVAGRALPGPVTETVCKRAIGHDGQIHEQLARCCGRTVLRTSIGSRDTALPGARGEGGPQSLIVLRIRVSTFD